MYLNWKYSNILQCFPPFVSWSLFSWIVFLSRRYIKCGCLKVKTNLKILWYTVPHPALPSCRNKQVMQVLSGYWHDKYHTLKITYGGNFLCRWDVYVHCYPEFIQEFPCSLNKQTLSCSTNLKQVITFSIHIL